MKRRLFLHCLARATLFGAASAGGWALAANSARAQTNTGTSGGAQTSTNAAPLDRRNGGPMPVYPPGEADRLLTLGNRGVRVHDPSTIIKCKDDFWVFYTGPGVPSWHSKDLVSWERGPRVFEQAPAWVTDAVPAFRGRGFWAPDITHQGDRYLLYYAASTFGKNGSAIGLASNPTLDPADPAFKWTDEGLVVKSTGADNFNTIDPAIIHDADGGLWLAFGSFWSGIKLIQLDPATGKRLAPDSAIYPLAKYKSADASVMNHPIEASFIYHHEGWYYLFVDWGFCCRGVRSTYEIRVGRSQKITGPYLDRDGRDMLHDGGTQLLATDGAFIGPGHAGIIKDGDNFWFSCHFYDGTRGGASALAIRPLTWNSDGWPEVGMIPPK